MASKKSASSPFSLDVEVKDSYSESQSFTFNPAPNCDVKYEKVETPWYSSKPDTQKLEIDCPDTKEKEDNTETPEPQSENEVEGNGEVSEAEMDDLLEGDNSEGGEISEAEMDDLLEGDNSEGWEVSEAEINDFDEGGESFSFEV